MTTYGINYINKRGDTRQAIKGTLIKPNGTPDDLTDATIMFVMKGQRRGSSVIINKEADIVGNPEEGVVLYAFDDEDLEEAGNFLAEFKATYPDGRRETYPKSGYINIRIEEDLLGGGS